MRLSQLINMGLFALSLPLTTLAHENSWRAVGSIGGGIDWTSNLGESQHISIINPLSDEFYDYKAKNQHEAAGLWELFLGAEWTINPHWGWQLGLGYNERGHWGVSGTYLQGADIQSANEYNYQYKIIARQLMFDNKFFYHYKQTHPYLFVGLGAAFNRAYDYQSFVPPFSTFTREYQNHTQTTFTFAVGLGLDQDLSKHTRLGLGYRFVDLGQVSFGDSSIDGIPASGTLTQGHLYTNEIIVQITLLL